MSIQRLRFWQWWLISLLVGAALGFVWTSDLDTLDAGSTYTSQFLRRINARTDDGRLVYQNIVIDPVRTAPDGKRVQRVTFEELRRNTNTGEWDPIPGSLIANVPVRIDKGDDYRIGDQLAEVKARQPELDYTHAWWKVSQLDAAQAAADRELRFWQRPTAAWGVAMVISFVLVGVVWPFVIRLLVKLGLGHPEEEESDGIDLSKVSSASPTPAVVATASGADRQQLDDLNERLEANVAGMTINTDERDEEEERRAEAATIRKLDGQRLESQESTTARDESKEYGGEYYPVARTVKKDD